MQSTFNHRCTRTKCSDDEDDADHEERRGAAVAPKPQPTQPKPKYWGVTLAAICCVASGVALVGIIRRNCLDQLFIEFDDIEEDHGQASRPDGSVQEPEESHGGQDEETLELINQTVDTGESTTLSITGPRFKPTEREIDSCPTNRRKEVLFKWYDHINKLAEQRGKTHRWSDIKQTDKPYGPWYVTILLPRL